MTISYKDVNGAPVHSAVKQCVVNMLIPPDRDGGTLEKLEANVDAVATAFGNLIQLLMERGVIQPTGREITRLTGVDFYSEPTFRL